MELAINTQVCNDTKLAYVYLLNISESTLELLLDQKDVAASYIQSAINEADKYAKLNKSHKSKLLKYNIPIIANKYQLIKVPYADTTKLGLVMTDVDESNVPNYIHIKDALYLYQYNFGG